MIQSAGELTQHSPSALEFLRSVFSVLIGWHHLWKWDPSRGLEGRGWVWWGWERMWCLLEGAIGVPWTWKKFAVCTSFYLSLERDFVIVMWRCVKDWAALFKEPLGLESSPKDQELLSGVGGLRRQHFASLFFDIIFLCRLNNPLTPLMKGGMSLNFNAFRKSSAHPDIPSLCRHRIVKFATARAKYAQFFTREQLCCIKPDQEDACFSEGFMLQTTRSFWRQQNWGVRVHKVFFLH